CPYPLSVFLHAAATPEIYTLSLHDALPISRRRVDLCRGRRDRGTDLRRHGRRRVPRTPADGRGRATGGDRSADPEGGSGPLRDQDRKSTRLNSSHVKISYAVFCLKKKKKHK